MKALIILLSILKNRFRTNRKQRLKQKSAEKQAPKFQRIQPNNNANIFFPGESRNNEETREKPNGLLDISQKKNLNRSHNMSMDYRTEIDESPKQREIRIKEAFNDHNREGAEQTRYFSRLERSKHKQKAIFDDYYKKYVIPSVMKESAKREKELQRSKEAKQRMDQLEIEQDNNFYTLKKEYNDILRNQIDEKNKLKAQNKEEKKRMHDHMEYKIKMYKDEELRK